MQVKLVDEVLEERLRTRVRFPASPLKGRRNAPAFGVCGRDHPPAAKVDSVISAWPQIYIPHTTSLE